jgi:hypothetical protein
LNFFKGKEQHIFIFPKILCKLKFLLEKRSLWPETCQKQAIAAPRLGDVDFLNWKRRKKGISYGSRYS